MAPIPPSLLHLALALPLLAPATPRGQDAGEAGPTESPPVRLELRVSPVVELYYELRARAEAGEATSGGDPLAPALAAAKELHDALGSILFWGPLDGRLESCRDAAELAAAFAELPERLQRPGPGGAPAEVPLRELALALAGRIAEAEAAWLEDVWPARMERLSFAAEDLDAALNGPAGAALYRDLCRFQRMTFEDERVPVLLVTRAPRPGAVTYRRAGGGGLCFVGLEGLGRGLLLETVVHESIHALDAASGQRPTLLAELRTALDHAGFDRRDRRCADATHALLFLHAGELMRRHLDPEHVDYGEREGVYERLAAPIGRERELFLAWLDGELELEGLVAGIVEALR